MRELKTEGQTEFIAVENRTSEGREYRYELIREIGRRTDNWRLPMYSIRITMTDADGSRHTRSSDNIFSDKRRATRFFNRMVNHLCTPIDLGYIIEDEVR